MSPLPLLIGLLLIGAWWLMQNQATAAVSSGTAADAGVDAGGTGGTEPVSPVANLPNAPVRLSAGQAAVLPLVQQLAGDQDPALIMAIIEHESAFDPNARGAAGEIGLMQILPSTAQSLDIDPATLFDPAANIAAGVRVLDWSTAYLSQRLGHAPTEQQVLGAYNAGVGNVLKGFIPFGYVSDVAAKQARWQQVFAFGVA